MPFCELCGKQVQELKRVGVEGAIFNACNSCSKRGKLITNTPDKSFRGSLSNKGQTSKVANTHKRKIIPATNRITLTDEIVLSNEYNRIIRDARMKKGFTHDELGMKLNEKATTLKKIEIGAIKPDPILVKKLERFLGINLYVSVDAEENQ